MLFHLHDTVARTGQVRHPELLRDHTVEAERFELREPAPRLADISCCRREPETVERLDTRAAFLERQLPYGFAVPDEHIEHDELRRYLGGEPADPRLGRVEAHLHGVEVERSVPRDHDLAVERRAWRQQIAKGPQLGEVAQQRPFAPRPQSELGAGIL